jgi:hypothetical protein
MTKTIDIPAALGLPSLPSNSSDTIAGLMWARDILQKYLTTADAIADPKGIEELKSVKIGGVDHWLYLRAQVILFEEPGKVLMALVTKVLHRAQSVNFGGAKNAKASV